MLTVADLFCGGGGLSLGFKQRGYDLLLGIDMNEDAISTFKINNPKSEAICKDMKKVSKKDLDVIGKNAIDVLIGGPPCEGFSSANRKNRSINNKKNFLFKEFLRIAKYFKPQCIVLENVPGLLSLENGYVKNKIFCSFEKLGYHFPKENGKQKFFLLNSADYGVPQIRKRVFFIATLDKSSEDLFFSPLFSPDDYLTVNDAISDLPPIKKNFRGYQVTEYRRLPKTPYQKKLRKKSKNVYNHVVTINRDHVSRRFMYVPQGGNWEFIPKRLMSNYSSFNNMHSFIYKRLDPHLPSTIIANIRKSMIIHPTQNRLISVREAARLQSFPDNHIFSGKIPWLQEQIGDAVPTFLAAQVAKQVHKILN